MVKTASFSPTLVLLLLLLILATPSQSLSYSQYKSLFSYSRSLISRVADLRAQRGDISGSQRARRMEEKLERGLGLGFWKFIWSAGWDYTKNYAWSDLPYTEFPGAVSDMNELLRYLTELKRTESDLERSAWVGRHYQIILRIVNSLFQRLLRVFRQSGALREVVETVQREVVEGGLLRDCLELGSNDLKGVIQILKEWALQYSSASTGGEYDL